MQTDNNFVRSGYERVADDNYQTIDPRCVEGLVKVMDINSWQNVIDSCSPQGSGILRYFENTSIQASPCADAFSKDYYCDWDIFNPPYKRGLVDRIIHARLENMNVGKTRFGVAALLRTGFDHAKTRVSMFKDCPSYAGQLKLLFRPKWFVNTPKTTSTPIHNYVWHIWLKDNLGNPPRVWYW